MDGNWSIITNSTGKKRLQIVQVLHIPDFRDGWWYMMWG